MRVKRALLSVSDKTGIVDFARGLAELDVEIVSTGGTASLLRSAGLRVDDVSAVTGVPDLVGGSVKSLHPSIHAGILLDRSDEQQVAQLAEQGIAPIDLVCVNLLPFEQTAQREDVAAAAVLAHIDIGGAALVRGAARNHAHVVVVTSPRRYVDGLDALRAEDGTVPPSLRLDLAKAAFRLTAQYDAGVANYLAEQGDDLFPRFYAPFFEKVRDLRYGDNPFQRAALYSQRGSVAPSVASADVLWGKELSLGNVADLDSALRVLREIGEPACVLVKHGNPCGCALDAAPAAAFERAHGADPAAAYGGVLGLNRVVDVETARAIVAKEGLVECILAPGFDPQALTTLTSGAAWGKSVRLIKLEGIDGPLGPRERDLRRVLGGAVVQEYDTRGVPAEGVRCVSEKDPGDDEMADLRFAWTVAKHARTNASVLVRDRAVVGVGAGQMTRVDAVRLAVTKAGERACGAALACDGFIPFRDALDVAAEAGVTTVVEPGGSRNDHDVIAAANEHGLSLLFTGMRHFRQG